MAKPKEIRRRIRAVKNVQKITNAMKMIASVRLKKAQDRAEAARPYAGKMRELMTNLAQSSGEIDHPLLEVREEKNVAYVIIGAERGMAGSYNVNVMNKALREIDDRSTDSVKLMLIGRKASGFFKRRPYEVVTAIASPGINISFAEVRPVAAKARSMFEGDEVDAVYLVYARFISPTNQVPTCVKLLPITPPVGEEAAPVEFIFEPDARELFGNLLPRYVDTEIYQAMVESQASEQGARMTAMSAASKNAAEMIDRLTLEYNKARQAAITTEILEVVTGAEALR
jgi:F-type H+-transporting ATPase subunit gamma